MAGQILQSAAQVRQSVACEALSRLKNDDQTLIVGRLELGYSYDQLALVVGKSSPDAARVALRRALARLVEEMNRG